MKKLLGLLVIAALFTFVACGPSAEELKAKHIADSTHVADSLAKEKQKADSIAKAEEAAQLAAKLEKEKQDSIAKAEAEKANKGKKGGKPAAKKGK
jgi:hypothetical protein